MPEYILQRDGQPPLIFEGEILTESVGDRDFFYGHDLRIYQIPSGKLVLEIVYFDNYKTKGGKPAGPNHFYAYAGGPHALQNRLREHRERIDEIVVGPIPNTDPGGKRRAALVRRIVGEYDAQVGQLLDHVVFAEEID